MVFGRRDEHIKLTIVQRDTRRRDAGRPMGRSLKAKDRSPHHYDYTAINGEEKQFG
jgi:hypothetical protein